MNQNNKKYLVLALAALPLLNSCNDSWLDPKPLSFYTPENTYVDAAGLYSALVACERNMRHEFFTDGAPILTEMYTADIAVHGKTDESGSLVDFDNEMLPARTKNDMKGKNGWYWAEGFKGIKYANILLEITRPFKKSGMPYWAGPISTAPIVTINSPTSSETFLG